MTYKLEEFLEWLDEEVRKKDNWEKKISTRGWEYKENEKVFFDSGSVNSNRLWKKILAGEIFGDWQYFAINQRGQAILTEWKQIADQREKERAQPEFKLNLVKQKLTHWTQLINQLNQSK